MTYKYQCMCVLFPALLYWQCGCAILVNAVRLASTVHIYSHVQFVDGKEFQAVHGDRDV